MYREDLDALILLFQKACSNVTISDEKNRYESLAEMKQHVGSRIKDFNVKGENPKVHFLLNKSEKVPSSTPGQMMTVFFPELKTEEATDAADNLFYVVNEFLQALQQKAMTPAAWVFTLLTIPVTFLLGYQGLVKHEQSLFIIWLALCAVLLIIILIWSNRRHFVTLDTRLESPSFFAKNREEFGKHAVITAISSIISGVLGYLLGHYLK